jgi:hypothetical protein
VASHRRALRPVLCRAQGNAPARLAPRHRKNVHCAALGAGRSLSRVETETLSAWVLPSAIARVEGIVGRRQLPGATNALEAAKAKGLRQVNRAIA